MSHKQEIVKNTVRFWSTTRIVTVSGAATTMNWGCHEVVQIAEFAMQVQVDIPPGTVLDTRPDELKMRGYITLNAAQGILHIPPGKDDLHIHCRVREDSAQDV